MLPYVLPKRDGYSEEGFATFTIESEVSYERDGTGGAEAGLLFDGLLAVAGAAVNDGTTKSERSALIQQQKRKNTRS